MSPAYHRGRRWSRLHLAHHSPENLQTLLEAKERAIPIFQSLADAPEQGMQDRYLRNLEELRGQVDEMQAMLRGQPWKLSG